MSYLMLDDQPYFVNSVSGLPKLEKITNPYFVAGSKLRQMIISMNNQKYRMTKIDRKCYLISERWKLKPIEINFKCVSCSYDDFMIDNKQPSCSRCSMVHHPSSLKIKRKDLIMEKYEFKDEIDIKRLFNENKEKDAFICIGPKNAFIALSNKLYKKTIKYPAINEISYKDKAFTVKSTSPFVRTSLFRIAVISKEEVEEEIKWIEELLKQEDDKFEVLTW